MSLSYLNLSLENIIKLCKLSEFKLKYAKIQSDIKKNCFDAENFLFIASQHLFHFEDTEVVGKCFAKYILQLVSRNIPLKIVCLTNDTEACKIALKNCIVLGLLCDHPDILQYCLKYFKINPTPPFDDCLLDIEVGPEKAKRARIQINVTDVSSHLIVLCSYKLLRKAPNEFMSKWNWSLFIERFISDQDARIRWMVKECNVILTTLTEVQAEKLSERIGIPPKQNAEYIFEEICSSLSSDDNISYSIQNLF